MSAWFDGVERSLGVVSMVKVLLRILLHPTRTEIAWIAVIAATLITIGLWWWAEGIIN